MLNLKPSPFLFFYLPFIESSVIGSTCEGGFNFPKLQYMKNKIKYTYEWRILDWLCLLIIYLCLKMFHPIGYDIAHYMHKDDRLLLGLKGLLHVQWSSLKVRCGGIKGIEWWVFLMDWRGLVLIMILKESPPSIDLSAPYLW